MTAVLTIKADAAGAVQVLEGVNRLIDVSVKSSEKLAAITGTIRGHWREIGADVANVTKLISGAADATANVAGAAKLTHAGFLSALGVAQHLNKEIDAVRQNATATARVMNSIRMQNANTGAGVPTFSTGGGSGFSFSTGGGGSHVPPLLPSPSPGGGSGGGGSGSSFLQTLGVGTANVMKKAGSALWDGAISGITYAGGVIKSGIGSALGFAWDTFKTGAVTAAAVAGTLVGNSIRLALKAEPIEGGFSALTASKGLGEEKQVLEDLREAARGTVSDLQLMTGANAALTLGAAKSTEELQLLIEGGRRLGKSMGLDATEGFEKLSLGIGRHSSKILDDLGLVVRSQEEYEKYAKAHNATTDALSEEEKALIFQQAAFDSIRQKMADLGEEHVTAGNKIERFKAKFSNLSVEMGAKFLPTLGLVADRWATFIEGLGGGKFSDGLDSVMDGVRGGSKKLLDFLFPKSVSGDMQALAADIWGALTDPSVEAFQIIGLRTQQLTNDVKAGFRGLWEDFKTESMIALDAFIVRFDPIARTWGAMMEAAGAIPFATFQRTAAANNKSNFAADAREQNKPLQEQIAALSETIRTRSASRPIVPDAARLTARTNAPEAVEGSNASKERLATATATREGEQAAALARKDAEEAAARMLREEVQARENLVSTLRDEIRVNGERSRELLAARANVGAAIFGQSDPGETIVMKLNETAGKLRGFPATFEALGVKLKENAEEAARVSKEWTRTLAETFRDFNEFAKRQANSFLQEGPQDGETVRVRATKRRAQRDLRRQNNAIVNDAFRSEGFNNEASADRSNTLNQRFPQLESALTKIRNPDGTTQLLTFQANVKKLVEEHAQKLAEARDAQAKLLKETAEAHKRQIALTEDAVKLMGTASKDIGDLTAATDRLQRQVDAIQKELERVGRLAKR